MASLEWLVAQGGLIEALVMGDLVKVGVKDGELELRIHEPEQARIGKGERPPLLTAD